MGGKKPPGSTSLKVLALQTRLKRGFYKNAAGIFLPAKRLLEGLTLSVSWHMETTPGCLQPHQGGHLPEKARGRELGRCRLCPAICRSDFLPVPYIRLKRRGRWAGLAFDCRVSEIPPTASLAFTQTPKPAGRQSPEHGHCPMPRSGPVAKMPTKDTRATMRPSCPKRADRAGHPDQAPAEAKNQPDHNEEMTNLCQVVSK